MSNLTSINNLSNPVDYNGLLMLCDVPNIVKYKRNQTGGRKAKLELIPLNPTAPNGSTITINGETVTGTYDLSKCKGRKYYLGGGNNTYNTPLTIATLCDALRNCPRLAADYNIYIRYSEDFNNAAFLIIEAKEVGSKYNFSLSSSYVLASNNYQSGYSDDELLNYSFAKLRLEVMTTPQGYSNTSNDNNETHITELVKNYYKDEVSFDISPVLHSISEYGKTKNIRLALSIMTPQGVVLEQMMNNLYCTEGYQIGTSKPYIPMNDTPCLLQHIGNGSQWANKYDLFIYEPVIKLSWLSTSTTNIRVEYLDSLSDTNNALYVQPMTISSFDTTINLSLTWFNKSHYISINTPKGRILYTIIKPYKATDEYTRIYYRNEYGGITFLDFTGKHTNELSLDMETFNKSNFDYYSTVDKEKEIIFNKDIKHNYSITTHLIRKNGLFPFESLAKSRYAWIEDENGIRIHIIVDGVKFNETEYDDIYTVTVNYHLSNE